MGKSSKRARKVAVSQSLRAKQNAQGFVHGLDLLERREGDEDEERRATELLAAHAEAQQCRQQKAASSDDDGDGDGDGGRNDDPAALLLDGADPTITTTTGANALILPSKAQLKAAKAQRQHKKQQQAGQQGPQLSKADLRRLKQVAERKRRRDELSASFGMLKESGLAASSLALLRPVHQRGARETKKQRLRRTLKLMRAGATEQELAASGLLVEGELLRRRREAPEEEEEASSDQEDDDDDELDEAAAALRRPGGRSAAAAAMDGSSDDDEDEDDGEDDDAAPATAFGAASAARAGGSRAAAAARAGVAVDRPAPETLAGGVDVSSRPGPAAEATAAAAATTPAEAARQLRDAVAKARAELGLPPPGNGRGAAEDDDPEEAALRRLALETTRAAARNLASEAAAAASLVDAANTANASAPRPPRVVEVHRPPEIDALRRDLPVVGMEAEILEAVAASDVVVLCGETGSGKTTQVPQVLYEAGYGCPDRFPERGGVVAVTQPRRVAAIATAERVAAELGRPLDGGGGGGGGGGGSGGAPAPRSFSAPTATPPPVGYQVRHDRRLSSTTPLQFLTDGVLLRHLQSDLSLKSFSAVVVDEAHERSLNTDLLLGLLSRVVPLRRRRHEAWAAERRKLLDEARACEREAVGGDEAAAPPPPEERRRSLLADAARLRAQAAALEPCWPLKLVIMSATLRTADFVDNRRLFPTQPPLITVPARQFPVTVHFARRTPQEGGEHAYIDAAFRKVCRIHTELPAGGVLVFLTGQREVEALCRRLRRRFAVAGGAVALAAAKGGAGKEEEDDDDEEEEEEEAAAGADAAEIGGERADAAAGVGLGSDDEDDEGEEDRDDFALMELDEEEEETVLLGTVLDGGIGGGEGGKGAAASLSSAFTREQLAEAEAAFEARYGFTLGGGGAGGEAAGGAAADAAGTATTTTTPNRSSDGSHPPPVHVLPLYAMLPQKLQARVFAPPPPGSRLIVVATNVAETSLTIPGVRYVVDAGRAKERVLLDSAGGGGEGGDGGEEGANDGTGSGWDADAAARLAAAGDGPDDGGGGGGVVRYEVRWVSKASAAQRAGRAGRTGPGHCYRLYSSAHYGDRMADHSAPEIAATPLEDVALALRAMGVDRVARFPFPTPPPERALRRAQRRLEAIGALERRRRMPKGGGQQAAAQDDEEDQLRLTDVGRVMALLPVGPRQARALVQALRWAAWRLGGSASAAAEEQQQLSPAERSLLRAEAPRAALEALPYVIAMAAALSIESPFIFVDGSAGAAGGGGGEDGGEGDNGEEETAADRQRRAQSAAAAHAPFRSDGQGDGVAAVRALCAYEQEMWRALAKQKEAGGGNGNGNRGNRGARAALVAAAAHAEAWCRRAFLLSRNLREMSDLRKQLVRTLLRASGGLEMAAKTKQQHAQQPHPALRRLLGPALCGALGGGNSDASSSASSLLLDAPLPPYPAQAICDALRRAQLAGWPDQVARRVRSAEHAARTAAGGGGSDNRGAPSSSSSSAGRAVRYAPCSLADDVFLHPRSALRTAAPEFVVYTGLVRTAKRCYMGGVAGVEASWLASVGTPVCVVAPAAAGGAALDQAAAPRYSARLDAVVEMREASYGARGWALQRVPRVPEAREDRAAAFAAALLGGGVEVGGSAASGSSSSSLTLSALLAPKLIVAPAASAARPELRGLPRVGELVGALARAGVDTRAALVEAWRRRPDFLRRELRAWVRSPGPGADAFDKAWGEVVRRAVAGAEVKEDEAAAAHVGKRGRVLEEEAATGAKKTKKKKKSKGSGGSVF